MIVVKSSNHSNTDNTIYLVMHDCKYISHLITNAGVIWTLYFTRKWGEGIAFLLLIGDGFQLYKKKYPMINFIYLITHLKIV